MLFSFLNGIITFRCLLILLLKDGLLSCLIVITLCLALAYLGMSSLCLSALYDFIWFNRNKVTHGASSLSMQELVTKATKSAQNHWNSILNSSIAAGSSTNQTWKAPPSGWIKINSDSIFVNGKAQSSCILRNFNSSLVLALSHPHDCLDSLTAKAPALLDACKLLQQLKIKEQSLNLTRSMQSPPSKAHQVFAVGLPNQLLKRLKNSGMLGQNGSSGSFLDVLMDLQMP